MAEKKNQKYRKNKRPISRNVYWTNKMKSSYQTKEEKDANEEVFENAAELGTEATNSISKQIQKKRIKRKYAEMKRQGEVGDIKDRILAVLKSSFFSAKEYVVNNSKAVWMILGGVVFLMGIVGMCSSCSAMFQSGAGVVLGTSYTADDEEILDANAEYCRLEGNVRENIENIEITYPDYDEYR